VGSSDYVADYNYVPELLRQVLAAACTKTSQGGKLLYGMFTYLGKSKMMLAEGRVQKPVDAILWQDTPRGGGTQRHFLVRPKSPKQYHLRIIVGTVVTTDRDSVGKGEVLRAAKLMGIDVADSHWSEVDALL
jgi:hypothetical protein